MNKLFACALLALSPVFVQAADVLLAGWNFNASRSSGSTNPGNFNEAGRTEALNPATRTLSPASHGVYAAEATVSLADLHGEMGEGWGTFAGSTLNLVGTDRMGGALTVVGTDNNGRSVIFTQPTTGHSGVVLTYATRGTGGSFTEHLWSWSLDGENWTEVKKITGRSQSDYTVEEVSFAGVAALNHQSKVHLKLTFGGGAGSLANNRVDNVQIKASAR